MCSRYARLALVAVFVTGCGLGGDKKAADPVVISAGKYSCLGQIADKAQEYINGKMNEEQVNAYVGCVEDTFRLFMERFHGDKDWNSFTPEEIRTFLQDNFLDNGHTISDELLRQYMVIKQNLIGGPADKVTRADLVSTIQLLEQVRTEAVRILPHVAVLNPDLADLQDPATVGDKIKAAETALNQTVQSIGGTLSKSQHPYPFSDLQSFLKEFRDFSHWKEHFPTNHEPEQWTHLVSAFKLAAVSPGDTQIQAADWTPFLSAASKWYLGYVKFRVGVRNQPVLEGAGFQNVTGLGQDVRDLLKSAVANQPDQTIGFATTKNLISAFKDVDWLPSYLRVESAERALEAFVAKILGGGSNGRSSGIRGPAIDNLWTQFSQWREIQATLQSKYDEPDRIAALYAGKVPALDFPFSISKKNHGSQPTEWSEFLSIFQDDRPFFKDRPLFKEDMDRVFLIEAGRLGHFDVTNGYYNLSKINVYRSVLEAIFNGYSDTEKDVPRNWKISQDHIEKFYCDFRDLGIDIGLVDKRNPNAAARTFMETKLFTYLADGMSDANANLMTFAQGIEEGAFLYSGGDAAQDIYDHMSNYCAKGGEDINGDPKLDRACVRLHLIEELKTLIHTMPAFTGAPGLPGFLDGLSTAQRADYSNTLLEAAFNKNSDPKYVELSELQTIAMVIHYGEAVFTRFNTNMDNVLDESEINSALPIFVGLVYKMGEELGYKIPSDGFAAHAFKFILATGRMPSGVSDEARIAGHWVMDHDGTGESWGLRVDRLQIARVFREIIRKMSASPSTPTSQSPCQ